MGDETLDQGIAAEAIGKVRLRDHAIGQPSKIADQSASPLPPFAAAICSTLDDASRGAAPGFWSLSRIVDWIATVNKFSFGG